MRNKDVPDLGTCFISGAISSCMDTYHDKFNSAQMVLEFIGYTVLNPAWLPPTGLEMEQYVRIDDAMLAESKTICMLPDWKQSVGAKHERDIAIRDGKEILYFKKIDVKRFIAKHKLDKEDE